MSQRLWEQARNARTLMRAHEALVRLRPKPDAPVAEWVAFHQRSAAVYRQVAEVDEGHPLEALYWATREKTKADELSARPADSTRRRRTRGAGDTVPATLEQAHEVLRAVRPPLVASAELWLAYHEHAAAVYAEVSEVDRGHHHEAVVWASRERVMAASLTGAGLVPVKPRGEAGRNSPRQTKP